MGCGQGWGQGLETGQGQGQWWVVVGVPRWYTDGGDDVVVGTDHMYRDQVCQWGWWWYGVMVHSVHHQGDSDDVIVVQNDFQGGRCMLKCGRSSWRVGWCRCTAPPILLVGCGGYPLSQAVGFG